MLAILHVITTFISVAITGWVFTWSIDYMQFNMMLGARSPELGIPLWPVHLAMPVGLGLVCFYFAVEFVQRLAEVIGRAPGRAIETQSPLTERSEAQ